MRLDTTNPNDMVVTNKSGTKYHFGNLPVIANSQTPGGPSQPNFYNSTFNSMVDIHGNTVTYTNGTITTDLGQTITIGAGITYIDSNGNKQTITIASAPALDSTPAPVSLGNVQCNRNDNAVITNAQPIWQGSDAQLAYSSAGVPFRE